MVPGSVFHITPGTWHRLEAKTDCRFFEVSTNHLDDVVRVKDRYGRN
jgi:quercetin dioxygenase-like cupin family protein